MLRIATHDSATGERASNLLSWLLLPFARTQSKTIAEQYKAGARMFDLRIREHKGIWYLAHGLFRTKKTFVEVLQELESFDDECYILVTYEGRLSTEEEQDVFKTQVEAFKKVYTKVKWGPVAVKYTDKDMKVDWKELIPGAIPRNEQAFLPLDGKHWQTFLPIPWLWKQFYFRKVEFNTEVYKFVDFL